VAIVFELVVHYDEDGAELRSARDLFARWPPIVAGQHRVPLHAPRLRATGLGRYELSIVPVSVSHGNAMDGTLPRLALTESELSELGTELYRILAKLDGYRCAAVGWDPEHLFDEEPGDEAESDWREEIEAGYLQGLVLSEAVRKDLSIDSSRLENFAPGFSWVPYQGTRI
jgi:hypothetical protein